MGKACLNHCEPCVSAATASNRQRNNTKHKPAMCPANPEVAQSPDAAAAAMSVVRYGPWLLTASGMRQLRPRGWVGDIIRNFLIETPCRSNVPAQKKVEALTPPRPALLPANAQHHEL